MQCKLKTLRYKVYYNFFSQSQFYFVLFHSQKSLFVLFALVAVACCQDDSASHEAGGRSGAESGEIVLNGATCIIAKTGTTNCTGVTGKNCSDAANLKVSQSLEYHFQCKQLPVRKI